MQKMCMNIVSRSNANWEICSSNYVFNFRSHICQPAKARHLRSYTAVEEYRPFSTAAAPETEIAGGPFRQS